MSEQYLFRPTPELEASREPIDLSDVTVLMPIGGKATRALEVTNDLIPKHLIRLGNEQTVLETICMQLQDVGFRKFVFCLGHHKEQNRATLSRKDWIHTWGVSYEFSEEEVPLGVDGAVLQAIRNLDLKGQGMVIPGDVMLNWQGLANMNLTHAASGADITMGTTSYVTERTTDVGKFIVENETDRLLWLYGRENVDLAPMSGIRPLTSVGANTLSMGRFVDLCDAFLRHNPHAETIGLRDQMVPWAIQSGEFEIHAHDIQGEILDLGTPPNIRYGQDNWTAYVG